MPCTSETELAGLVEVEAAHDGEGRVGRLRADGRERLHVGLGHPDVGEHHVERRLPDGDERGDVGVGLDDLPSRVTKRQAEHQTKTWGVVADEDAWHGAIVKHSTRADAEPGSNTPRVATALTSKRHPREDQDDMTNRLREIEALGQAVWIDNINRGLLDGWRSCSASSTRTASAA